MSEMVTYIVEFEICDLVKGVHSKSRRNGFCKAALWLCKISATQKRQITMALYSPPVLERECTCIISSVEEYWRCGWACGCWMCEVRMEVGPCRVGVAVRQRGEGGWIHVATQLDVNYREQTQVPKRSQDTPCRPSRTHPRCSPPGVCHGGGARTLHAPPIHPAHFQGGILTMPWWRSPLCACVRVAKERRK